MEPNQNKTLIKELKKLKEGMGNLEARFTIKQMFIGGMFRGAGILVGATLLVLVGGTLLDLAGLLPGLTDIVQIILDAFDKAKLQ